MDFITLLSMYTCSLIVVVTNAVLLSRMLETIIFKYSVNYLTPFLDGSLLDLIMATMMTMYNNIMYIFYLHYSILCVHGYC